MKIRDAWFGRVSVSILTAVALAVVSSDGSAQTMHSSPRPAPTEELRAIWVPAPSQPLTQTWAADAMIEEVLAAGFNTLVVQVRVFDDSYYQSVLVPRATALTDSFADPLAYILGKVRERRTSPDAKPPIRVVAAIETLRAHSMTLRTRPAPDSVLARHPDWVTLNYENKAVAPDQTLSLEPGLKSARLYLAAVVTDLVSRYEIDGLYLDGVRYPGDEARWGYHPVVLEDFRRVHPDAFNRPDPLDPRWIRYRQEALESLVGELAGHARHARPGIEIFAGAEVSGFAPVSYEQWAAGPVATGMQQDWISWGRKGLVDWVCVKNRQPAGAPTGKFESWLALAARSDLRSHVAVGIEGGQNFNTAILGQMRGVQTANLGGVILYDYANPTAENRPQLMAHFGRTLFARARLVSGPASFDYEPPPTPTPVGYEPTTPTLALPAPAESPAPDAEAPAVPDETVFGEIASFHIVEPTPAFAGVEFPSEAEPTPLPTLVPPTPTPLPLPMEDFRLRNGITFRGRVIVQVEGRVTILTEDGAQLVIPRRQIVSPDLD